MREEELYMEKARQIVDEVLQKALKEVAGCAEASGDSVQTVTSLDERYQLRIVIKFCWFRIFIC